MDSQDFCRKLIAVIDAEPHSAIFPSLTGPVTNDRKRPVTGRGNYAAVRWVALSLATPIGSIESINVMPYRFDLDPVTGNLHHFDGEIQLVACEHQGQGRRGPMARTSDGGNVLGSRSELILNPARYYPRLDRIKRDVPCLTWDECFDQDGKSLSRAFKQFMNAFTRDLNAEEESVLPMDPDAVCPEHLRFLPCYDPWHDDLVDGMPVQPSTEPRDILRTITYQVGREAARAHADHRGWDYEDLVGDDPCTPAGGDTGQDR